MTTTLIRLTKKPNRMKKLFTFIFLLSVLLSARAESETWTAAEISGYKSNDDLDGYSQTINDNLSISLSTADGGSNAIKYRNMSYLPSPYVTIYNGNTITITATDATITSVSFNILTESDEEQAVKSDITPGWKLLVGDRTFNSTNGSTWTGEAETVTITGSSKTALIGLTIEYTITDDEGGEIPETPEEYKTAILRFSEDQVTPDNESSPKVEISDNDVTAVFISNSTSAKVQANNGYFGSADDFITIPYRYSSGTRSSNGTSSNTMCTVTVPCAGKLVIYGYNNSDSQTERTLNVVQNDEVILDYTFDYNGYVQPEGQNKKVYPIIDVSVQEGTVYLLYITNGLCFFGFDFVPADNSYKPEDGYYLVGSMTNAYDGGFVPNPSYQFEGPVTSAGINDTEETQYTLSVGSFSSQNSFYVVAVKDGEIISYSDAAYDSEASDPALLSPFKDGSGSEAVLTADETYKMKLDASYVNVTFTLVMSSDDTTVPLTLYFTGTKDGSDWAVSPGDDKTMQSGTVTGTNIEMQTASDKAVVRIYVPEDSGYTELYYEVTVTNTDVQTVAQNLKKATIENSYFTVTLDKGNAGDIIVYDDPTGENEVAKFSYSVSATALPTAVDVIFDADVNAPIYNIFGQKVDDSYRGIVIKNGKKFIKK